jgi:hypothetical protein
MSTLSLVCGVGMLAFAGARFLTPRLRWAIQAAIVLCFAAGAAQTLLQGAAWVLIGCGWLALAHLAWRTCGSDLATFAAGIFWSILGSAALSLIEQPLAELRHNGAALVALAVLTAWAARRYSRPAPAGV